MKTKKAETGNSHGSGPSWAAMLLWLLLAMVVAGALAYWLTYPFFHSHPR